MRHARLAAATLAACAALTGAAQAGGLCDPNYRIECRPVAGAYVPQAYGTAIVAIPRESFRPVVTGDPFIGGSGYVKKVPTFPLAVVGPDALRPVPYVWGWTTNPGELPQDPPPEYVRVQVPVQGYRPSAHYVPVTPGLK